MKNSILFILACIFANVIAGTLEEVDYYGTFHEHDHDEYDNAGVIIASPTNHLSFEEITVWHEVIRILSREATDTGLLNLSPVGNSLNVHVERIHNSLMVIIVHEFKMGTAAWLKLFIQGADQAMSRVYSNLHGNSGNLKLSSKILISCCNSTTVGTHGNRFKRQELDQLVNETSKSKVSEKLHYIYKQSMGGRSLRLVALKGLPGFVQADGRYHGFLGEIVEELSEAMNFTVSEIMWEDVTGVCHPKTGMWDGLMGRIQRREADLSASLVLLNRERADAVQFLTPILSGSYTLHVKKLHAAELLWNAYFKVFRADVWIAIMGLILTTPIVLTLIMYASNAPVLPSFVDNFTCIWGIYCQQGLPGIPRGISLRIVCMSTLMSAFIISCAYSGTIISSLATSSSFSPFETIQEFVDDGTYQLITIQASLMYDSIKLSDEPLMRKLMGLMKPVKSLPLNYPDAMIQVCQERVAFYVFDISRRQAMDLAPCGIASIDVGRKVEGAIVVPKGSQLLNIINIYLNRFRHNGIINRLERKYYGISEEHHADHIVMESQAIIPLIVISALGMLMSVIIFVIERKVYLYTKDKNAHKLTIKMSDEDINSRGSVLPGTE